MKLSILFLGLIGLLLISCATSSSSLPFYNTSQWNSFYTGGNGSSTETAVIINSKDDKKTVAAEDHYLDKTLSNVGKTYQINNRITYGKNGKVFDKVEVIVDNNIREFHFDITIPTGQSNQP